MTMADIPRTPKIDLENLAHRAMVANGFEPDFPPQVEEQLAALRAHPPDPPDGAVRDLRAMPWSSIDNDTSRDLDQIEVAERLPNGDMRVLIGIADVDSCVSKSTPIDQHAASQTTSVYTGVRIFPMLPEELSTGKTSLLEAGDRACVVIEVIVEADGSVRGGDAYPAIVRNQAQLAYSKVGPWLEGTAPSPAKVAASPELQAQLRLQDEIAQSLRSSRFKHGALDIDTVETQPVMSDGKVVSVAAVHKNRASQLIEDFMIAANGVIARLLLDRHVSAIRRVVKTPERWERIVELAAKLGETLPPVPDSAALNAFLVKRKAADPVHFVDLSLAVIKLMGPGEYVVMRPGDPEEGHFGLAVRAYTHSTAPNRRFADMVTQRLVKTVLSKQPTPYSDDELTVIARNCTLKEDAARKVEREMSKRIAAVALSGRVGETFHAVVTGVTPKGVFVRVLEPHVEGRLMRGEHGLDVGDQVQVRLLSTDPERGFIDFAR
jgi:VacB/RNase II family 3'-5' exoribonuclease